MLNKSLLVDEEKTAHMLHKNESTAKERERERKKNHLFGLVGREEMTCSFFQCFLL